MDGAEVDCALLLEPARLFDLSVLAAAVNRCLRVTRCTSGVAERVGRIRPSGRNVRPEVSVL